MIEPTERLGPREVFARMRQGWLGQAAPDADLLAEDVVIEIPFAAPGRPRRIEGRDAFLDLVARERGALPGRLEEVREVAVHETADPEVIVVEYEISGTVTATGRRASAAFIGVLRVHDGKTLLWREYQDTLALAEHLGRP
jgi:ketosteroid isomerase-like protein